MVLPVVPDVVVLAAGSAVSGLFVAVGVVVLLVGLVISGRRVSRARDLAREAGEDPDRATSRALLGDSFWSRLIERVRAASGGSSEPSSRTGSGGVRERLAQLEQLRDEGLVTPAEYDERRRAILDSL